MCFFLYRVLNAEEEMETYSVLDLDCKLEKGF